MAGAASEATRWYCTIFADLVWRTWEQEVFLYNPHTGETHILNDLSWQVLRYCSSEPCTEMELLRRLGGAGEQGDLPPALNHLLNHLYRLGLVVAHSSQ